MGPPVSNDSMRSDESSVNEAFQILSDETRLSILQVLWEEHIPSDPAPMRFSEIRERMGVEDPGRLNYHLNKLRTNFVRRTEEGYELRESGKRVVRMMLSGTATRDPEIDPVEIGMACWYCGGETEWSYSSGWRILECTRCEARCVKSFPPGVISKNEFPPSGLLDRTPDEINEADRIWGAHRRSSVIDGVCPECAGNMLVEDIEICDEHDPDWDKYQFCETCGSIFWILVSHICEVCKYSWRMPARFYPARHPAVISFYYEHGVEFDLATYEQRSLLLDFEQEVLSDPLRIEITILLEGDKLTLAYDEEMEIVDVSR